MVSPEFPPPPLVSIIILNYNGMEHIKPCLESIRRNTPEYHEIIVIDNASTDKSPDYLHSLPDIILVENPVNIGCPPARAQAMAFAKGAYVVLLDNDTIVTKGWLTKFIGYAAANPRIGTMGPRSNYASGLQFIPNVPYSDLNGLEQFAYSFGQWNRGQLIPTTRLIGFCMFIRREVIDEIGSIDASFGKFGFEDDDYTWRVRIAGFQSFVANDIFIHHTGGPEGRGDPHYNKVICDAWEVFKEKWGLPDTLPYGQHTSPAIETTILAQPFDPQKHYIPLPDRSEAEKLLRTGHAEKQGLHSAPPSLHEEIMAYIHKADAHIENNDLPAARAVIQQAMDHASGHAELYVMLAKMMSILESPEALKELLDSKGKKADTLSISMQNHRD